MEKFSNNKKVFEEAEEALKEVDDLKARQAKLLSQKNGSDSSTGVTKSASIIPADLSSVPTKYWIGGGIAAAIAMAYMLK